MGLLAKRTMFEFTFFLLNIFPTFPFLVATSVLQSHMERRLQDDSGFINIDCGLSNNMSYLHNSNGQYYTSDAKYINSGKNFVVKSSWDLLNTVRSFPEGRKNCYTLSPLQPNNKYLIRTRFMYGNYDKLNTVPTFDLYLGVNKWLTVKLRDSGTRLSKEIIHVATSESIDVCLVNTDQGIPFISALELRPMDNSSYPASQAFSLALWDREDIGSKGADGRYSVKDDGYDRLWYMSPTWPAWSNVISTNETVDASQENPCKIPPSVLVTAAETNNSFVNLKSQYTEDEDPKTQVYAYWYFAELELLGPNESREFNIVVPHGPGYKFGPVTPKYLQLTTISSPRMSINEVGGFKFTLTKTDKSNLNPILNAVEIYTVLELPTTLPTNQEDANAVIAIKDKYAVPRIWQGDPCLPKNYQWDGLNCTYDGNNASRITSLNLSKANLIGKLPPTLSNLTSLKYLNLSNNGFTGRIPEFLAYLPVLNVIDLSGNNLTGPVPRELLEKANNKSIDLRLEGNPEVCKSYPCKVNESKKRHHYIIPVVSSVASVSLLVIIGIIFLAFKQRKNKVGLSCCFGSTEGFAGRTVKTKNKKYKSSEIARITANYSRVLGKGGFGTVYYGVLQDGTQVAVKVLSNTSRTIIVKQFFAEADLLTRIHHVNLVSLIGYCDEHAQMALVYEYMSSGDLQMHLSERNENPLSWNTRLRISIDAAQGLDYLHNGCQPPIIHRDIKPSNILLDEMGHAKISDFGLSRFFTTDSQGVAASTDLAGTRGYLDPEYFHETKLSEKSDVYGFGVVLLQLLSGQATNIKQTNDSEEEDLVYIVDWVSSIVESGDILKIVDRRLQGDLIITSAWKFLEIAMECVKPTGRQRPTMSEVVADLKLCYASVEKNASFVGDNPTCSINSNQAFDTSLMTLPSLR